MKFTFDFKNYVIKIMT